jgi:hypothetical protein
MADQKTLLLADAIISRSYEASFGWGQSTLASLERFQWNPNNSSFQIGDKDDILFGSWHWKSYPCTTEIAATIIVFCATETVNAIFNTLFYKKDTQELCATDDSLIGLELREERGSSRSKSFNRSALTISYYGSDNKLIHLYLSADLTQSFWSFTRKIKGVEKEKIVALVSEGRPLVKDPT